MPFKYNAPIERVNEGSRYTGWIWVSLLGIILLVIAVGFILWFLVKGRPQPAGNELVPASIQFLGYVKTIEAADQGAYVAIDPIEWLSGEAANRAMTEDGACGTSTVCYAPSGFYIRNPDSETETLVISPEVKVKMQTLAYAADGNNLWDQPISLDQWVNLFADKSKRDWKQTPFIFTVVRGKVMEIREQYVP